MTLPDTPTVPPERRVRLEAVFERTRTHPPSDLAAIIKQDLRIDLTTRYGGVPIAHPFGKASGQLSCTLAQVEDDIQAGLAFVVLKSTRPQGEDAVKLANELRAWVGKEIGPIAKPKDIRFGDNLPKTRSGKIMRRLLRSLAKGEDITQDTSTLENPAILDQLKETR